MKILILDTYYPKFLKCFFSANQSFNNESYSFQLKKLIDQCFGTSDFYSRHLNKLGFDAYDLIANCLPLQKKWLLENHQKISIPFFLPSRLTRLPLIGKMLSNFPTVADVAIEQIIYHRPEILYCQDLWFLSPKQLLKIKPYVRLVVGQIASPLPPKDYLANYDLILTSFPHFVPRLKAMGISSEYFRIGFDTRILELIGEVNKNIDVSFVGGISRHHGKALPLLEYLAANTPIQFFGYGAENLVKSSLIRQKHNGEVWGLDMYRALSSSRITINRHINVAENYANNMRLYEATGVGSLLITDDKDNLSELFTIGKEIIKYSTPEEAVEAINYFIDHPEIANQIALAGQRRTLRDHTYFQRMEELAMILPKYL